MNSNALFLPILKKHTNFQQHDLRTLTNFAQIGKYIWEVRTEIHLRLQVRHAFRTADLPKTQSLSLSHTHTQ